MAEWTVRRAWRLVVKSSFVVAVCGGALNARAAGDDAFEKSLEGLTPEMRALATKVVDRVVEVRSADGLCSGALVAEDLILTAWHCVDGVFSYDVVWRRDAHRRTGVVVAYDKDHDLAVIKIDRPVSMQPLKVVASDTALANDEAVLTIGHPKRVMFKATTGAAMRPTPRFFLFDAKIEPGNSGGPVLNAKGEIVGVVSMGGELRGDRTIGDSPAAAPIRDVVQRAQDRRPVPWYGADNRSAGALGFGRDRLLDELSGTKYSSLTYRIGIDWKDRIRTTFSHMIMRPERVYGYEVGYAFKELPTRPAILVGRNYYSTQGEDPVANKVGVNLKVWFLDVSVFRVEHEGRAYVAYAVGL